MNNPKIETPHFDRIQPWECVNAKVRKLHKLLDSIYQSRLHQFKLKGSMLSILFTIGKHQGITQKQLSDRLFLDQSTISRDIGRLIKKGWITTVPGSDLRSSLLTITDSGLELLEKISPIWEKTHQQVLSLIGTHQLQYIDHITTAVKENLDQLKLNN